MLPWLRRSSIPLQGECAHGRLVSAGWDSSFDPNLAVAKEYNIISKSVDFEGLRYPFCGFSPFNCKCLPRISFDARIAKSGCGCEKPSHPWFLAKRRVS